MKIKFNHLHFLGATSAYSSAKVVLCGCPFDGTTTYLPGSRFAPNAIREASDVLETYSPILNRDLSEIPLCDLGDLELPFGNTPRILNLIKKAISNILNDGKIPLIMGGEHLITYPIISAYTKYYPNLSVIQLDAHADLRENYLGEKLSHSTVMRRIVETVGGSNLIQLGIRSGTQEEFDFARQIGSLYDLNNDQLNVIKNQIEGKEIYISIDLDILDPSIMPGTGTPEPGGLDFEKLIEILTFFKEANVVGMDIVELLPQKSSNQISSSIVAAKIIRESLLLYFL